MAKKILILQGHPDPAGGHFCHGLADAYAEGAREGGADVETIDIAKLDFPLLHSQQDYMKGEDAAPEALKPAIEASRRADHFLFIYPLWMGTMPAMLKAFLEQAYRPDVALGENSKGFPKPLFKGKTARVAITMGMPAIAYRWYFGAHSLKSFERNILRFAGVSPIKESLFGMIDAMKVEGRKKRLEEFKETGRKDAA